VLDASALLAYLRDEPGADIVQAALENGCLIGAINLAEVLSKLAEVGQDPAQVLGQLETLGDALVVEPADEMDAVRIGELRPRTKEAGLSLGDRACIALGERTGLPTLTADTGWKDAPIEAQLVFLR
jgi:PIN domain nuclease of toxin-antitoxin system